MKILKKFLKILFIFSCLFPIFNISINYYLINKHSNFIKNHIETIDENLTLKNMSWTTSFLMPTFFLLDKQINKFKNLFVMYDFLPYIFSFDKFSKFKIYAFEENVDKTILDISADLFLDQTIKMKKGIFSFEGSEFFIGGRFCHQNNLNLNYEIIPDCQNVTFNQSVFDINKIFNNFIGLFTVENITKNNHFVIENLLFSEKQNKNNKITIDKIIFKKINEEDFVFSGGIKKHSNLYFIGNVKNNNNYYILEINLYKSFSENINSSQILFSYDKNKHILKKEGIKINPLLKGEDLEIFNELNKLLNSLIHLKNIKQLL